MIRYAMRKIAHTHHLRSSDQASWTVVRVYLYCGHKRHGMEGLPVSVYVVQYSKLLSCPVVQVANNRYSIFGKTSTCRNSDERYQERFIA